MAHASNVSILIAQKLDRSFVQVTHVHVCHGCMVPCKSQCRKIGVCAHFHWPWTDDPTKIEQVYNNQLEIERQSKAARLELARFRTNLQRLGLLVRKVSQEIKEAGDLDNYISVLEELSQDFFQNQQSSEGSSSSK